MMEPQHSFWYWASIVIVLIGLFGLIIAFLVSLFFVVFGNPDETSRKRVHNDSWWEVGRLDSILQDKRDEE